jgi:hypothetical protein
MADLRNRVARLEAAHRRGDRSVAVIGLQPGESYDAARARHRRETGEATNLSAFVEVLDPETGRRLPLETPLRLPPVGRR